MTPDKRRRFDRARAEFTKKTADLGDAEYDAAIRKIVREVRHRFSIRLADSATVTEMEIVL